MWGRGKSMTFKEPLLLARSTAKTMTLTKAPDPSLFSGSHKTGRLSKHRRNLRCKAFSLKTWGDMTFPRVKSACCHCGTSFFSKHCLKGTASPKTLQMTLGLNLEKGGKVVNMFHRPKQNQFMQDVQGLVTAIYLPPQTEVVSTQIWDSLPGSPTTDVDQGLQNQTAQIWNLTPPPGQLPGQLPCPLNLCSQSVKWV